MFSYCFIKNNHETLLDLADFALQEQPGDNLMAAISPIGHNGSYTLGTKPIKSLKLHYSDAVFKISVWVCVETFPNKLTVVSLRRERERDLITG